MTGRGAESSAMTRRAGSEQHDELVGGRRPGAGRAVCPIHPTPALAGFCCRSPGRLFNGPTADHLGQNFLQLFAQAPSNLPLGVERPDLAGEPAVRCRAEAPGRRGERGRRPDGRPGRRSLGDDSQRGRRAARWARRWPTAGGREGGPPDSSDPGLGRVFVSKPGTAIQRTNRRPSRAELSVTLRSGTFEPAARS